MQFKTYFNNFNFNLIVSLILHMGQKGKNKIDGVCKHWPM
jgi:hypothetical protein